MLQKCYPTMLESDVIAEMRLLWPNYNECCRNVILQCYPLMSLLKWDYYDVVIMNAAKMLSYKDAEMSPCNVPSDVTAEMRLLWRNYNECCRNVILQC